MNEKRDYVKLSTQQKGILRKKIQNFFENIITELNGFDNDVAPKQHIKETPFRIAKMYVDELFQGCFEEPPTLKTFINEHPDSLSPVIVNKILVKSLCSHHFVPFKGHATIYYIPNKRVVGLSKFSRIVDYYSRRPQIQEELTRQIANYVNDNIEPHIFGVGIRAQHLCMTHRGANEPLSDMETYHIIINNNDIGYTYSDIQEILSKHLENGL